MAADYDIAICGAGPVGLALAALLVERGSSARIVVLDAKSLEQACQDPRSIALSYGSAQILQKIGAWPIRANPIHQIHVSRRGHFGRTLIEREDFGVPALGYVTRYGTLVEALAKPSASVTTLRPASVSAIDETADAVRLTLADGRAISAALLVQAEGGLFAEQTSKVQSRDYGQTALVAQVKVSAAMPQRAFERFTSEGPLALLPQDEGYALVWCGWPEQIASLMALPEAAFLQQLGDMFGSRLGRFTESSARFAFPLGLNADPAGTARSVAIGNAAQTLHPVAGQGLNLGLRDATVLAAQLAHAATPEALAGYQQARRNDRKATITLTDIMARVFASAPEGALTQSLLGASLGFVDAFQPAKRLLAEQMMFGYRA